MIILRYNRPMGKIGQVKGSWDKAGEWYKKLVADKGHYYHQQVVIPGVLRLLDLKSGDNLVDVGCGNGVLAGQISKEVKYTGVEVAENLIKAAMQQYPDRTFVRADATKNIPVNENYFSKSTFVLALQNIKDPKAAILNVSKLLIHTGKLVIVLNHPCFRIPRQSGWEIDPQNKIQYRRINRYLSPLEIPITIHPGEKGSPVTWDYHYPLSAYTQFLAEAGMVIEVLEEWTSDKESEGKAAKSENRARAEFPLFLAIRARKDHD